jgi:hypothetical protein
MSETHQIDPQQRAEAIANLKNDVNELLLALQQWADKTVASPSSIMDNVWNRSERLENVIIPILTIGNDAAQTELLNKWKEFDEAFVDYRMMLKREGWPQAKKEWAACAQKLEEVRKLVFSLK